MPDDDKTDEASKHRATEVEILLKFMEMEWKDHFQTRTQTWRTLQMEAVLAAGLVGIDWRLQSKFATTIAASLLIVAAYFGACITRHHRQMEIDKLNNIAAIQDILVEKKHGLFAYAKKPEQNKWSDVFKPKKSNTSLFILRTHIIFMIFGIVYLIFTLVGSHHAG